MAIRPDNRLADAPMVPVDCRRCGAGVQVRKSSWNQTSVQWTGPALDRCEERCTAVQLAAGGGRGLFLACSALSGSINDAVRTGALVVVDGSA
ncbi:ferredoxin [Mycolicibacterium sphagni]|uniref:Ferredoxin n=1 Tax=Mycolicibacterium sphagni TaxID=1786 RepID=A0A255DDF1_9MYCO|nr:ferredoxin [Mycolicibacterium sphagni]OYN74972.1 ferredoxin [Mycolicibacterium sphagni]